MSDNEDSNAERNKLYQKALNTKSNEVKLNFALERLRSIEDRLDNGISEAVFRNSWAVGIFGTLLAGLFIAIISKAI